MLKIDFFRTDIIEKYENAVAEKVISRNGKTDDIIFIPEDIKNPNTNDPYKISIHDLLTLDRDHIFEIDGIDLYMCICSAQKYKYKSNAELLHALSLKYKDKVDEINYEHSCYTYKIDGVYYHTTNKKDKSFDPFIYKAVELIKNEFAKYNTSYADKYFTDDIQCIDSLYKALDNMICDLKPYFTEKSSQKPIIDYSIISGDLRHELLNSIGIRTCPYCNRNYVTRYGKKGSKSTADLDHFYQKEWYPLFALSLFNFIPSCPICNSRMKNIHPAEDTLYPYEEGFDDDACFELIYTGKDKTGANILHFWQALEEAEYNDFDIEIVIKSTATDEKRKKIEKSKDLFHLTEVYADHKQEALEAAFRTRIYCEGSYKEFCKDLFDKCKSSGMANSSVSDLESYMFRQVFDDEWLMFGIFMNDEKRRYDKPLSKMIYDIYKSGK